MNNEAFPSVDGELDDSFTTVRASWISTFFKCMRNRTGCTCIWNYGLPMVFRSASIEMLELFCPGVGSYIFSGAFLRLPISLPWGGEASDWIYSLFPVYFYSTGTDTQTARQILYRLREEKQSWGSISGYYVLLRTSSRIGRARSGWQGECVDLRAYGNRLMAIQAPKQRQRSCSYSGRFGNCPLHLAYQWALLPAFTDPLLRHWALRMGLFGHVESQQPTGLRRFSQPAAEHLHIQRHLGVVKGL